MGPEIEPFDVESFFAQEADRRRRRRPFAEKLAGWITDYGERAPWDGPREDDWKRASVAEDAVKWSGPPAKDAKPKETPAADMKKSGGDVKKAQAEGRREQKRAAKSKSKSAPRTKDAAALSAEASRRLSALDEARAVGSPLYRYLDEASGEIVKRRLAMRQAATGVLDAINDRSDADVTVIANIVRIGIGFFWLFVAGWLYVQYTNAQISGAGVTAGGIAIGEAQVMATLFASLAALAVAAGLATLALGAARGAFSEDYFVDSSKNYGRWVAKELKDFDARLTGHRGKLAEKHLANDDVAREVAEAHVTALEALTLFHDIGFVIDDDVEPSAGAVRKYRDYLNGCAMVDPAVAKNGILAGGILGLVGGVAFGAVMGSVLMLEVLGVSPMVVLNKLGIGGLDGFEKYPRALLAIIVPAAGIVVAGGVAELIAATLLGGDKARRLRQSLDALRGEITAAQAPRARDVSQRVEDLAEIFRVRLAKLPGGGAAFEEDLGAGRYEPAPSWRRGPEEASAPRFVDPGFQSSPRPFLADPHNARSGKKIAEVREAKRGFLGIGKGRRP